MLRRQRERGFGRRASTRRANLLEPKKVIDSVERLYPRRNAYVMKHSIGIIWGIMDVIYVQGRIISSFGVQGGMVDRWSLSTGAASDEGQPLRRVLYPYDA